MIEELTVSDLLSGGGVSSVLWFLVENKRRERRVAKLERRVRRLRRAIVRHLRGADNVETAEDLVFDGDETT